MIFESEMVRGWMIMAIMLLWRWPKLGNVDDQQIHHFLGAQHFKTMPVDGIPYYRYVYV
jgi:hypothetical protein